MIVCKCYGTDGTAILMKGLMMDKRLNRALLAGLLSPWHPLPPISASFFSEKVMLRFREQDDDSGVKVSKFHCGKRADLPELPHKPGSD